MNWLDIIIIVVMVVTVFFGLKQGLIKSVLSLVGLIVGIVLASNYYRQLGDVMGFISNKDVANIVAFIIILVLVMVIATIAAIFLRTILKAIMLGWIDHLGGAVLGLLMGGLSIGALLAIIVKYTGSTLIADSAMANFLLDKFPIVLGLLPSEFDSVRNFFK